MAAFSISSLSSLLRAWKKAPKEPAGEATTVIAPIRPSRRAAVELLRHRASAQQAPLGPGETGFDPTPRSARGATGVDQG